MKKVKGDRYRVHVREWGAGADRSRSEPPVEQFFSFYICRGLNVEEAVDEMACGDGFSEHYGRSKKGRRRLKNNNGCHRIYDFECKLRNCSIFV